MRLSCGSSANNKTTPPQDGRVARKSRISYDRRYDVGPHFAAAQMEIAILGAGLSGIAAAIELTKAGIDSFVIYEKGDGVGGCWRYTTYPGVACDVVSQFYCFSYEPNPNRSRVYSPGKEICAYIEACAEKYDITRRVRTNTPITAIKFAANKWQISDAKGNTYTADLVIAALGPLHTPHYPDIPGLDRFAGTKFHSALWNHDHDLRGRRVAVIGTGSSGAQIIPEVAKIAQHLTVFCRTPSWIMPRPDRAYTEREMARFKRFPLVQKLLYWASYWQWETKYSYLKKNSWRGAYYSKRLLQYMRAALVDPALRSALMPDHVLGCKRLVVSSDYLPSLQLPNVTVVTEPVARICENGAIGRGDAVYEFDTLVLATGYKAFDISKVIDVTAPNGLKLKDVWKERYVLHRTTAIPGFPNLFLMLGPNTGLGYSSMTVMIEAQARYIARCIQQLAQSGASTMTPRNGPAENLYRYIQRCLGRTVLSEGCRAWYKDANGVVHSIWPNRTTEYRRLLRNPRLHEFELT
jgi:cation diffusion facilitator CzcD-associated flavoprotein CzcO